MSTSLCKMNSASTNFVKQSIGHEDRLNFRCYILGSDLPPPRGKTAESKREWLIIDHFFNVNLTKQKHVLVLV